VTRNSKNKVAALPSNPPLEHKRHMIGYARVSMNDQDNRRQIDALTKFGVDERDIYTDKASGKDEARPGWQACWKDLTAGDLLVVVSIDRLGRSLIEVTQTLKALHAKGCDLKILARDIDTRTPMGRVIFGVLAAFAEMERELIRERTLFGLAAARARGRFGGAAKQISDEQVREAIARLAAGEMKKDIVAELGITRQGLDKRINQLREQDLAMEGQNDEQ
jgi:DNA invertase Pin-like site-specific DNA recombinase